eukprot:g1698.t1
MEIDGTVSPPRPPLKSEGSAGKGDLSPNIPAIVRLAAQVSAERRKSRKCRKTRCAVFFDFDCTISKRHLFGTMRGRWSFCMDAFDAEFTDWSDQPKLSTTDLRFVEFIFGGKERLAMLRDCFDKLKVLADLYISTHGLCNDVLSALKMCDMIKYFEAVQAHDGVWTKGQDKMRTNANLKQRRALPKMIWIEKIIESKDYAPKVCWFADDTARNYDAGCGVGVLPRSRKTINVIPLDKKDFVKNGLGLKRLHFGRMLKSIVESEHKSLAVSAKSASEVSPVSPDRPRPLSLVEKLSFLGRGDGEDAATAKPKRPKKGAFPPRCRYDR